MIVAGVVVLFVRVLEAAEVVSAFLVCSVGWWALSGPEMSMGLMILVPSCCKCGASAVFSLRENARIRM